MFDIITDSACDLTPETAAKLNIEIVPFYVSLDGEHYRKEGKEITVRDFYQFMVDNPSAYPKTSLASIEDFEEVVKLDVAYIDNWSLWGDVKILFKTIYVVFAGKGAK